MNSQSNIHFYACASLIALVVLFSFYKNFQQELLRVVGWQPKSLNYGGRVQSIEERLHRLNHELLLWRNELTEDFQSWKPKIHKDENSLTQEIHKNIKKTEYGNAFTEIAIPWTKECPDDPAISNLLISDYYSFTTDLELCGQIRSNNTNSNYGMVYNFTCSTQLNNILRPQKIDMNKLNKKYLEETIKNQKNNSKSCSASNTCDESRNKLRVLMTVYTGCLLSPLGEVFIGKFRPETHDCLARPSSWPPKSNFSILHEEVYVISQYWGNNYFHKMIENIPRLGVFLEFLKNNPQIKILCADDSERTYELFRVLGLESSRLVTGWMEANITYVPRPTECGVANFFETQLLNKIFRDYTSKHLLSKPLKRSKILLVQRTGVRSLKEHAQVAEILETIAIKHNLELHIFTDQPVPSLNETMVVFQEAVAVVAPHGAGLANLIFSAPGTLVLEGVLKVPNVNLCYQRLAYVLGMRWYGMTSLDASTNFVTLNPGLIAHTLDYYLNELKSENV